MPRAKDTQALVVAGFDATNGAGVTADLSVVHASGAHGCSVPSCVVVQDTRGVHATHPISPDVFRRQLELLERDMNFDCIKVGALPTAQHVEIVLGLVRRLGVPTVVDPVLRGGTDAAAEIFGGELQTWRSLLHAATVSTPNLDEIKRLGRSTVGSCDPAAVASGLGATLLVTGGHGDEVACDILYRPDGSVERFEGTEIEGAENVHGTGCRLSTSLALHLARGDDLSDAVRGARDYLRRSLVERVYLPGRGRPAFDHRRRDVE